MNAVKRKRAKGGGAKPQGPYGEKRAVFSTRITQETRDRLDRLAPKTELKNVSQLVEQLIVDGLDRWEVRQKKLRLDALFNVLRGEAQYVEHKYGSAWTEDRRAQAEIARLICNQLAGKLPGLHSITIAMQDEDDPGEVGAYVRSYASEEIMRKALPGILDVSAHPPSALTPIVPKKREDKR